jgi:hypothetical protein
VVRRLDRKHLLGDLRVVRMEVLEQLRLRDAGADHEDLVHGRDGLCDRLEELLLLARFVLVVVLAALSVRGDVVPRRLEVLLAVSVAIEEEDLGLLLVEPDDCVGAHGHRLARVVAAVRCAVLAAHSSVAGARPGA